MESITLTNNGQLTCMELKNRNPIKTYLARCSSLYTHPCLINFARHNIINASLNSKIILFTLTSAKSMRINELQDLKSQRHIQYHIFWHGGKDCLGKCTPPSGVWRNIFLFFYNPQTSIRCLLLQSILRHYYFLIR